MSEVLLSLFSPSHSRHLSSLSFPLTPSCFLIPSFPHSLLFPLIPSWSHSLSFPHSLLFPLIPSRSLSFPLVPSRSLSFPLLPFSAISPCLSHSPLLSPHSPGLAIYISLSFPLMTSSLPPSCLFAPPSSLVPPPSSLFFHPTPSHPRLSLPSLIDSRKNLKKPLT
jgi:hypothetical protein